MNHKRVSAKLKMSTQVYLLVAFFAVGMYLNYLADVSYFTTPVEVLGSATNYLLP